MSLLSNADAGQIVALARANAVVDSLYVHVDGVTPISVVASPDREWSSETKGGLTTIGATMCNHPEAALYHELLHADLKIAGFKQHLTSLSRRGVTANMTLLGALDNELQHHRMLDRFLKAGFSASQFYADDDVGAFASARTRIEKASRKPHSVSDWFLIALTLLAPGGAANEGKRGTTLALLKTRAGKQVAAKVEELERLLAEWSGSTSLDSSGVLERIFALTEDKGYWIGKSTTFPADGFFVGPPFQMSDT